MEKFECKTRDIYYSSSKNGCRMAVHSQGALKFAKTLEGDNLVKRYETNVSLENWQQNIPLIGIRTSYRECDWTSDFVITLRDDTMQVREIIIYNDLAKRAEIQKAEISRRYWQTKGVEDWKLVVVESKGGGAW